MIRMYAWMFVYNINNYIYLWVCALQQQDQCSTMHGDIMVYCFPHGLPSMLSSPWGSDVDPIHMASAFNNPSGKHTKSY